MRRQCLLCLGCKELKFEHTLSSTLHSKSLRLEFCNVWKWVLLVWSCMEWILNWVLKPDHHTALRLESDNQDPELFCLLVFLVICFGNQQRESESFHLLYVCSIFLWPPLGSYLWQPPFALGSCRKENQSLRFTDCDLLVWDKFNVRVTPAE